MLFSNKTIERLSFTKIFRGDKKQRVIRKRHPTLSLSLPQVGTQRCFLSSRYSREHDQNRKSHRQISATKHLYDFIHCPQSSNQNDIDIGIDPPIGIPVLIFSINALFMNCSSARTRVVYFVPMCLSYERLGKRRDSVCQDDENIKFP